MAAGGDTGAPRAPKVVMTIEMELRGETPEATPSPSRGGLGSALRSILKPNSDK